MTMSPALKTTPVARALNLKNSGIFKLVVAITALLGWVIGLGGASATMLQHLYDNWHLARANALTIYLPPDADAATLTQLQQSLPTLAGVTSAQPVAPSQLQQWLQPVIPNPESLPLPTVLEVNLAPNADRPQLTAHIQQAFPTAEIDDHQPLLNQVENAVRSLQAAVISLAAVMLALMALLVVLTVRTGLAAQKSTLHLLTILGATDAFLARAVTLLVTGRVFTGTALGITAAAVMLAAATAINPAMAATITPTTWLTLVTAPLLLPVLAAFTATLTTARLLHRL